MDKTLESSVSCDLPDSSTSVDSTDRVGRVVHALANKLLPITVFSELALQHCHDPVVMKDLEKIRKAAEEARKLMIQIRADLVLESKESTDTISMPVEAS